MPPCCSPAEAATAFRSKAVNLATLHNSPEFMLLPLLLQLLLGDDRIGGLTPPDGGSGGSNGAADPEEEEWEASKRGENDEDLECVESSLTSVGIAIVTGVLLLLGIWLLGVVRNDLFTGSWN